MDSETRSIDEVNKENINMAPREAYYYHTEQGKAIHTDRAESAEKGKVLSQ